DHVLGAVDDKEVVVGVQVADIASMMPIESAGFLGCCRVLIVARHYEGTADHDLAAFAYRQLVSVVVHDRDGDKWRWTTSRREPLESERAVCVQVLLRCHGRDHHRRLGLAKKLTEHWADSADRLLKPGR